MASIKTDLIRNVFVEEITVGVGWRGMDGWDGNGGVSWRGMKGRD